MKTLKTGNGECARISLDGGPCRPRLGAPSFKRVRPPAPPNGHFRTYKIFPGYWNRRSFNELCHHLFPVISLIIKVQTDGLFFLSIY
ncbi:Latent-Transforming Growth Factor Beta-Binding Protein 2 [Manis pentadactyla]|nr:Latent-Transforming Growth Factor Beta-Binding Protein 2 [Manis pentadactyla]